MISKKYDVIIIGAGIGGLVCGCYLAKAGRRVLIIEQHDKPGGYCTSFARKGYQFDVGVHYLGSIKRGVLGRIIEELGINRHLRLKQFDPTDKIIMPDFSIYIKKDPRATILEFKRVFPGIRKDIDMFFKFILGDDLLGLLFKVKKMSFDSLLNSFCEDVRFKATINVLLCNLGVSCLEASAVAAVLLLRGYILDTGYYPEGGMQEFANAIAEKIKCNGGELLLRKKVSKIVLRNKTVQGVIVDDEAINAKIVISNADATQTFKRLIEVNTPELKNIGKLIPSISIFAVYLGIDTKINELFKDNCNLWLSFTYDLRKQFDFSEKILRDSNVPILMISPFSLHNKKNESGAGATLGIFTLAPSLSNNFWEENRTNITERLISIAEKTIGPFSQHIKIKESASPKTFHKYTLNRNGAAYGWAATTKQIGLNSIPQRSSIDGLYLVGHWVLTNDWQSGIPGVAFSGRRVAEYILKNCRESIN